MSDILGESIRQAANSQAAYVRVKERCDQALRERDEARKAAREYFEASLNEVVGRSCYAEVVKEAYVKYPFLKEMPLDP